MKAIILSAGQGRRLLPLTANQPKCLLPVGGKSVLQWQIEALGAAGVNSCTVVVGFGAEKVRRVLSRRCAPPPRVQTLFNPYFDTADNLVTCWAAREQMDEPFLLVNGDTLFDAHSVRMLLASPSMPVTVAVGHKHAYDADDMKVSCLGRRVLRVGKDLGPEETDAESLGMLLFRGPGPALFRAMLERIVAGQNAERMWYLSAVSALAAEGLVQTAQVNAGEWQEIDYPADLRRAERLVSGWIQPAPEVTLGFDTLLPLTQTA